MNAADEARIREIIAEELAKAGLVLFYKLGSSTRRPWLDEPVSNLPWPMINTSARR